MSYNVTMPENRQAVLADAHDAHDAYDVVVIGAGLLGCFTARELSRYRLRVALVEAREDVCTGISRANTAIVYSGYDNKPSTLKAQMCVAANRDFARLCAELGVPIKACGSLMVAFGPNGEAVLQRKLRQGAANGVEALRLLTAAEVIRAEPNINPAVRAALFSPNTATVNPWELCIAAAENAISNGVELRLASRVVGIKGGYTLSLADGRRIYAQSVVNCAGLAAADVALMVTEPGFRLVPTSGDYLVLDNTTGGFVNHVIFHEPEQRGKGVTLVPTVDGNLMIATAETDPVRQEPFATSTNGLEQARQVAREVFPGIPLGEVIRNFGAIRPNPYWMRPDAAGVLQLSDESIHSFIIDEPTAAPGFINVAGIKTPGMTCAHEIATHVTTMLLDRLGQELGTIGEKDGFDPCRKPAPRFERLTPAERARLTPPQNIVCRCRLVTEAEVRAAVRQPLGARSLDGVKRRTGCCMGRCQGGFCTQRIVELMAEELGCPVWEVQKEGVGSPLLCP